MIDSFCRLCGFTFQFRSWFPSIWACLSEQWTRSAIWPNRNDACIFEKQRKGVTKWKSKSLWKLVSFPIKTLSVGSCSMPRCSLVWGSSGLLRSWPVWWRATSATGTLPTSWTCARDSTSSSSLSARETSSTWSLLRTLLRVSRLRQKIKLCFNLCTYI